MRSQQDPQTILMDNFNSKPNIENAKDISLVSDKKQGYTIVWKNVIIFSLLHIGAINGAYLFFFDALWSTRIFAVFLYICSGLGITAGVHRLWSHKAYKAKLPLRFILIIFNTIAYQNSIFEWARDHRVHHKYSDTDADPHNASRGFFFSHIGWLLVTKRPEVIAKGKEIDMSDLWNDPMLRFQHMYVYLFNISTWLNRYYMPLVVLACFSLPTYIPTLWGEDLWTAFYVCALFRYVYVLNVTWLVNSAAHMWGNKPYDKTMKPVENKPLSLVVLGEGFHNYHHTFPWDYKSSELGDYGLNFTNLFMDAMIKIGWAYDLKTVSSDVIKKRVKTTGDGSHPVWGWDDQDITLEEKRAAIIVNSSKCDT